MPSFTMDAKTVAQYTSIQLRGNQHTEEPPHKEASSMLVKRFTWHLLKNSRIRPLYSPGNCPILQVILTFTLLCQQTSEIVPLPLKSI